MAGGGGGGARLTAKAEVKAVGEAGVGGAEGAEAGEAEGILTPNTD
jgi:hypothetical protein